MKIEKSNKLDNVCYDIRGRVLEEAKRLEEEGYQISKLNIGNPQPFGFEAPEEILQDVMRNLRLATGYCDSKGLFAARKAIMQYYQQKSVLDIRLEDVICGNGVSELIVMSLQALLNDGDEVLVPSPDYPLWTAAVSLAGGRAVHYRCDESDRWYPDLEHMRQCITAKTRALVIINPNNPTGALYPTDVLMDLLALAREHQLVVFSDEIYDKILYDGATHVSTAALADDLLIITFNGLSKSYRCAGFRSGWLTLSGPKQNAKGFIEGLNILSNMRLCANVPAQYAIQTALGGYQSIDDLVLPTGRLGQQRDFLHTALSALPGISCVKPQGALYAFFRVDPSIYHISTDEQWVLDLLLEQKILLVQGSAFNISDQHHFRVVFLPNLDVLKDVMQKFSVFLQKRLR